MRRPLALLLAAAAFYAVAVFWILTDRGAAQHIYDDASAANTSESGVSLAYAYLRRSRRVEMLTQPLSADSAAQNGVVFRIGSMLEPNFMVPQEETKPRKGEKKKEQPRPKPIVTAEEADWVERGGRLVLAVSGKLGALENRFNTDAFAQKVFPFAPGIERVSLPDRRGILASSLGARMIALYTSGPHVVIAREVRGAGDIIIVVVPEMFLNSNLRHGNHLALLVALAGAQRPVYFDEYVHGLASGGGALDLMKSWGLGPFLLLALGAAILALWRGASRIGPPEEDDRDIRSEAVDLVASLGALYRKSTTDRDALALYQEALTRSVAARTGLRGDALHQRVAELVGGRVPPDFSRALQNINEAFRKLET
jgi:hypothetical protein